MFGTNLLPALIFGVVGLAILLVLWGVVQPANAEVFNQFVDSCEINGKKVTRLTATAPAAQAGLTSNSPGGSTACTFPAANAAATAYVDEYARTYTAASGVPGVTGIVRELPGFMTQFAPINRLAASILPLVYLIGIIAGAYGVYRGATGSLQGALAYNIGKVIFYVAAVITLPVILGFVTTAATANNGGAGLAVNDLLKAIFDLLFAIVPTVLLIVIMAAAPVGTGIYGRVSGGRVNI